MKTKNFKAIAGTSLLAIALVIAVISSCKKDEVDPIADSVTPGSGTTTPGTISFDAYTSGTTSTGLTAGQWYVDKVHSNVMWETKYYEEGAMLTGRFNMFNIFVKFNEANPANTQIKAWVVLSTFNTGESGRDAYGKCGPNYMGVQWDTLDPGPPVVLAPKATTDTAWFTSTSCTKYGDGFLVKGDLKFKGVTSSVDMYMDNTAKQTTTSTTDGTKVDRVGLSGAFTMKARTIFGVTSTSIDDEVLVRIDCNARNVKYQ